MIDLKNLTYGYKDNDPVLQDVSIHLPAGELLFLTGRSGAGKTSLLKLLYLALRPNSGELHLFSENTSLLNRSQIAAIRRRIGVIFQDFRLLDHLTVEQNVLLPLYATNSIGTAGQDNVRELLNWVGLGHRLGDYPPTLSGGEKQRVAIARAMINSPDIILADEPTGNIDPEMSIRVMQLLIEMQKLGRTVIIATHDLALVQEFDAPILELADGQINELVYA